MSAQTTFPTPSVEDSRPVGFRETRPVLDAGPHIPAQVSKRSRWRNLAPWLLFTVLLGAGVSAYFWTSPAKQPLPAGIIASNGRLEATEVDIAAKLPGRIEAVLVQEGDFVERGQVVARMDTSVLRAQLHEARAEASRARMAVTTANAIVDQRRNELSLAQSVLHRSQQLVQGQTRSIKAAALVNGFWHLGGFASLYREMFGETPQQTLAVARGQSGGR